jgi:hypothetical protein
VIYVQTDPKTLARLKELLELKEKTDAEIDSLVSGAERPKRTWTRRANGEQPEVQTQP